MHKFGHLKLIFIVHIFFFFSFLIRQFYSCYCLTEALYIISFSAELWILVAQKQCDWFQIDIKLNRSVHKNSAYHFYATIPLHCDVSESLSNNIQCLKSKPPTAPSTSFQPSSKFNSHAVLTTAVFCNFILFSGWKLVNELSNAIYTCKAWNGHFLIEGILIFYFALFFFSSIFWRLKWTLFLNKIKEKEWERESLSLSMVFSFQGQAGKVVVMV